MPHRRVLQVLHLTRALDLVTLALLLAVFGVFIVSGLGLYRALTDGRESHRALCALQADYQRRIANSEAFLNATQEERVKKYGPQLAAIPDSTIRNSVVQLRLTVKALDFLECG